MIQDKQTDLTITSTVQGDKIAMGIDAGAMAHIMGVLTDLYSDPKLAILREYATNALDSHVEAGQTRPIEVTTPTQLSPFFTVRDYGIGMSHEDIQTIYSQYGASTKRGTNEQVGMLGLGCKSALSYTNQFTLVGVKNGVRVTVMIGRDEDGAGSMTVVDTSTTHEPNGVTVQVPAKLTDAREFEQKAASFFRFWKPGTVLLNGQEPPKIEGLRISDDFFLTQGEDTSYIIMGNVGYPVEANYLPNLNLGWRVKIIARVPIGALNFTPSREALHYTPKTVAALRALATDFRFHAKGSMQRLLDEQPTHADALATLNKWQGILPDYAQSPRYSFKGKPMPTSISRLGDNMVYSTRHGKLGAHNSAGAIQAQVYDSTLWVEGYDKATFTPGQKKKLQKFTEDAGDMGHIRLYALLRPGHGLSTDEKLWIKPEQIVKWADVNAVKLPRNVSVGGGRLAGSYDCHIEVTKPDGTKVFSTRYEVPADEVNDTDDGDLYWTHGNLRESRALAAAIRSINSDAVLVCLPGNRLAKFQRDFPKAVRAESVVKAGYDKWIKTVTLDQRKAYTIQTAYGTWKDLLKLDPARVADPAIKEAIRLGGLDVAAMTTALESWQRLGYGHDREFKVDTLVNPLDRYPLFDYPNHYYSRTPDPRHIDHLYLYLNSAYAVDQAASAV